MEIAKASNTIKTMIEDLGLDEDDDEPVPLPNVNGAIMRKVCDQCLKCLSGIYHTSKNKLAFGYDYAWGH